MPDRKEPRLEIDPVKPTAPSVERPASTATARARPEMPARPTSAISPAKAKATPAPAPAPAPAHPISSERPAVHAKPEAPAKPISETPLRHQPVEPAYRSERAGSHGKPADSGGSGGSGGHYPANLEPNGSGSGGSHLLVGFALLLALAGLIFGGWQYMHVDKQQQSIQALADRVQELEIRLSATGQNLSEAGNTFSEQLKTANEKLKWADDEINKLWRLANNQIRPNIRGLQEQTKGLDERLSRAERQSTEVANLARSANDKATEAARNLQLQTEVIKKDLAAVGQRLTEVTLATSTLDQRLRNQETSTRDQHLRNQDQSSKVTTLTQKVEQLEQRVSRSSITPELQKKMAEQEEILASLEASRSQLVSRVTRLMEDVQVLQQAR